MFIFGRSRTLVLVVVSPYSFVARTRTKYVVLFINRTNSSWYILYDYIFSKAVSRSCGRYLAIFTSTAVHSSGSIPVRVYRSTTTESHAQCLVSVLILHPRRHEYDDICKQALAWRGMMRYKLWLVARTRDTLLMSGRY